ncbi:GDP-mannose 4,6-dehydratase [Pelagibacterales bacterium SAG-MED03]|nr:GDP-mannose 4,6-dehydratase [Pelagibacterales bacterium SAG-MED03]
MKNNIIITGGLGFIGSNLIDYFIKKKFYVVNIDKISYSSNKYNVKEFSKKKINKKNEIFEVDYVKGFAMFFNKNKIKKIGMFDKNIFLYLEEIDLCKRLRLKKEKIFISKKSKVIHLGAKSSNIGFEYDKCRNWHWMWSQVYFDKKFYDNFYVYKKYIFKLINNFLKTFVFALMLNKKKTIIFYLRFSGILNSLRGKKSWYRPLLK